MKNTIFNFFEPCFTEYIGKVLNNNEEYRQAVEKEGILYERFKKHLTDEQKIILEECYSSISDSSAVAEKIVYQQGAKDLVAYLALEKNDSIICDHYFKGNECDGK